METKKNQEIKEEELKKNEDALIVNDESKVRKFIKWGLSGLAVVATGVLGFFIGRNSVGDDDEESKTEEKTE